MIVKEAKREIYDIWTNKLTKVYGKRKERVTAVEEANIEVLSGAHGFLGPNGAGKTSTINMIVGGISVTSGEIKIRGKRSDSIEAKRLIGLLPQNPSFYRNMTAEKYLAYMGRLSGLTRAKTREKSSELLIYFKLFDDKHRKIKTYSGGMKQRLGLAAALIHDPKILILDEPTANLDPMGRDDVIKIVKELSKQMTVFVSSHVLSEIEEMCDDVTIINKGKIILVDSIENIKKRVSQDVYELDTDMNDVIYRELQNDPSVKEVFTNKKGKLEIIPLNAVELQKTVLKIISTHEAVLHGFERKKFSLRSIFTQLIKDDDAHELHGFEPKKFSLRSIFTKSIREDDA